MLIEVPSSQKNSASIKSTHNYSVHNQMSLRGIFRDAAVAATGLIFCSLTSRTVTLLNDREHGRGILAGSCCLCGDRCQVPALDVYAERH